MTPQPTKIKDQWKGCLKHDFPEPWCGQCEEANTPPAKGEEWEKQLEELWKKYTSDLSSVGYNNIYFFICQLLSQHDRELVEKTKRLYINFSNDNPYEYGDSQSNRESYCRGYNKGITDAISIIDA